MRQSCTVGLSFALCIVCITETFPFINKGLQLAPFPTRAAKVAMLHLLLFDFSLCFLSDYTSTFFFRNDIWRERNKPRSIHSKESSQPTTAADEEEKLLDEEVKQNLGIIYLMFMFVISSSYRKDWPIGLLKLCM